MTGFFIAADIYGPMIWHGDPDPDIDPMPRPMLARYELPDDEVGKALWQLIVDAVARDSGAVKVHEEIAHLRLLRDGGAA